MSRQIKWIRVIFFLSDIDCGQPSTPAFSSVWAPNTTLHKIAVFTCQVGYVNSSPLSNATKICNQFGVWAGADISCVRMYHGFDYRNSTLKLFRFQYSIFKLFKSKWTKFVSKYLFTLTHISAMFNCKTEIWMPQMRQLSYWIYNYVF